MLCAHRAGREIVRVRSFLFGQRQRKIDGVATDRTRYIYDILPRAWSRDTARGPIDAHTPSHKHKKKYSQPGRGEKHAEQATSLLLITLKCTDTALMVSLVFILFACSTYSYSLIAAIQRVVF